jgi:hypothetical protein
MGRGGGCGKETLYRGSERWNGTGSWTSSLIGLKSQSSVAGPVQMLCGGVAMATDIARPRHCHEADIGPRGTLPIFDQTPPIAKTHFQSGSEPMTLSCFSRSISSAKLV